MTSDVSKENKSTLVQIINEIDELNDEEKNFVLYWLKAKKSSTAAVLANATVKPNNITLDEIYEERNDMRNEKR